MTLNAVMALILRLSPNLTDFQADCGVSKILSPSSSLLLLA